MKYLFSFLVVCALLFPSVVVLESPSATVSVVASIAHAQDPGGLVSCSGPDCTFCSVVTSVNRVITFIITLAIVIATIIMAWAGVKLVMAQGNPGALSQAKGYIFNVIIGVCIILIAWTLVDTLLKVLLNGSLADGEFGVWNEISDCGEMRGAGEYATTVELNEHDIDLYTVEELVYVQEYQVSGVGGVGGAGGFVPSSVAGQLDAVVSSQKAGKLCYAFGDCIDAVSLSNTGYPTCGFNVTKFIDSRRDGNKKISQYFTVNDIAAPKEQYVYIDPQLPPILDALSQRLGTSLNITSGYRSPAYNRNLAARSNGVASCSRHMSGLAVDIVPSGSVSQQDVAQACNDLGARFTKADYNSHTHCDWGHLTGRASGNAPSSGPR